ncbi:coiled-coil domain-containing protein 171-like [Catharus ustulatus]|uniref:Uncharacterized protein n=1 Tax=Catharus ustulatus TaxID=91951 RepID=A0A8C3UVS1_CATUS|nr:coiled-coil domain-containing protein 171-like [Catharus ustulatus]
MEGKQLPPDRNLSEMATIKDLRKKLQELEEKNLDLTNQHNREMSRYKEEIMNLRLELERGEALRQALECELSFARKEAQEQMDSAEDKLQDAKTKFLELQVFNDKYRQKISEMEKMFHSAQRQREEEQQKFEMERNNIHRVHLAEVEFLIEEKTRTEKACQDMNVVLQDTLRKLRDMEVELHGCSKILKLQANHLDFKITQQQKLVRELEAAKVKIKKLEENVEAARLAHMECKHTMQLRIQELEDALNEEQGRRREAVSVAGKKDFGESENAHERGKEVLQRQCASSNVQWREGAEERRETEEPSGRLVNPATSFSLHEGPVMELSILLNIFQSMEDGHVIARHPDIPLEALPWREFCELLRENVEALILNLREANKRVCHCKHKTDTMNNAQQNQEDASVKMSEQLKAQEDCREKENQYHEHQYSNLLAEFHARTQRNIAILQQEISEISQRLHTAEVESRSLHLQLEEFKWTFSQMQKDAEKAHRLQEQLNELQHNLSDARVELRRRDQVLNQQKKLLKDMEQDRQWLREALQEAEDALQQAAKDNELIINRMKAADATLNEVKNQAMAPGAAAATLLPSLQLQILPEEAMRGRPEAAAFQDVLISFMDLYSLAAAREEALTTGRESLQVHFEPEAPDTPPTPAKSLGFRFVPRGDSTRHGPAPDGLKKFS